MKPLPVYQCHKKVRAAKIVAVKNLREEGKFLIFANELGTLRITDNYWSRHMPAAGGYYVLYDDGYESYSPAEPFESGYTLIQEENMQ